MSERLGRFREVRLCLAIEPWWSMNQRLPCHLLEVAEKSAHGIERACA